MVVSETPHPVIRRVVVSVDYGVGEDPIKLAPVARYCQLVFEKLSQIPGAEPATKYQTQRGVQKKKRVALTPLGELRL